MKFYLDEGVSPAIGEPLSAVFLEHEFTNTHAEGLVGTLDVPLFRAMRERSVDVFITLDRNQLRVPREREAIVHAGVHWLGIHHGSGSGRTLLARQAASLLIAIAALLENLPTEPTAYVVKSAGKQFPQIFARTVRLSRL